MQTSFQFEDDLGVVMAGCLAKVILVKLFVNMCFGRTLYRMPYKTMENIRIKDNQSERIPATILIMLKTSPNVLHPDK